MAVTVTLYTRDRCHLCEKAKAMLLELQAETNFAIKEVDIDLDDHLTEKYGLMIPVVEIDGEEVQYGHIDKDTVRNRLQKKT